MRFIFLFLLSICSLLQGARINEAVVNVYSRPDLNSPLETQAIYGDPVNITDFLNNQWIAIALSEEEGGWISPKQITHGSCYGNTRNLRPTKNLFNHVYRKPGTTVQAFPLLTLPYGAPVMLVDPNDASERWIEIFLVTGEKAWIQRGDVDFDPKVKTLEEMLSFSKKFLELPYTWGGNSSYGFDCSAFMKMLFKEMGVSIPRNSRNQAKCKLFTTVSQENLVPGDLIFFGNPKVHHVGLYLGENQFIHAGVTEDSPKIQISSLKKDLYQSGHYAFHCGKRLK